MADRQETKTPEELGEAVAQKIEALFSGMFGEEQPKPSESHPSTSVREPRGPQPSFEATQPLDPAALGLPGRPKAAPQKPAPTPREPKAVKERRASAPSPIRPPSTVVSVPRPAKPPRADEPLFEKISERIEALILNLEWEVTPQTIVEIADRFRELEPFFPGEKTARSVIAMTHRVLQRFKSPDASPHPGLVKLLTDCAEALKIIRHNPGDRSTIALLMETITGRYKEIIAAASARTAEPPTPTSVTPVPTPRTTTEIPRPVPKPDRTTEPIPIPSPPSPRTTTQVRPSVVPAEPKPVPVAPKAETPRARKAAPPERAKEPPTPPVAPVKVAPPSPTEERLPETKKVAVAQALEALADRVLEIADAIRREVPLPGDLTTEKSGADGVLTFVWYKTPLAIPSSMVEAVYPLTTKQAEQFKDKASILIGPKNLQRLPLKKPPAAEKFGDIVPTGLVHLTWNGGDYFLLVDRSVGFHRSPPGVDVTSEPKVKLGATVYSILNQSTLR